MPGVATTTPGTDRASPSPKTIAIALIAFDLALVILYIAATYWVWPGIRLYQLLNLDGEASLAAWATSSQLLLCAASFAIVGRREPHRYGTKTASFLVAGGFLFLSADEAAAIHENVTVVARAFGFQISAFDGHGAWIPLYAGLGLGVILVTRQLWLSIWREQRLSALLLIVGCSFIVCGGVILEILGYGLLRDPVENTLYGLLVAVEEAFELIGVSLVLTAAVNLLAERHR